ncbi:protein translocase subunit SecD [Nocardioides pantholopis]|uniref:protein translocase subunit SecD n=1 Tax=Nocardioides pantholopis TaxID=2483798 RepID=UPI000F081075|nr:protein translocase subunit SecD [Nocardioides pantholopis]
MARKTGPGRMLLVFLAGVVLLYGLTALAGEWKPQLGLDLQGGTRITLKAQGDASDESLEEARKIIDQRVNGSGVAEADVTTQSGEFIVVEIPGENARDLVDTVKRQAQMRFRLVACTEADGRCGPAPGTGGPVPGAPSESVLPEAPQEQPAPSGTANRPRVGFADETPATPAPSDAATPESGADSTADPIPTETAEGTPAPAGPDQSTDLDALLAFQNNPDQASVQAFNEFECPTDGSAAVVVDDPDKPLVTCEFDPETGTSQKYLLSAAAIEGTDLKSASAGIPQGDVNWVVNLDIGGKGEDVFEEISRALVGTENQFAIVLDGQVISAPTMQGVIPNGEAQISGNFTEETANSLATSLKFGALPITFEDDATTENIGPSLAGNQLTAGLWAGALGLGLVMLYCLLYYRGLGIVVLASLAVAAAITYALVLLLAKTAGFTLTLPGIAGLIIAVGVTADSFILFFERIRDEMREGRSMRVAVETGWKRAKVTRLAANTVSLLSAAILYIFATGAVKGFGFALGLSTLIDLAVLFWFTKPFVSWLAQFKFFNGGGKLSGLSPETLGIDAVPAGGKA